MKKIMSQLQIDRLVATMTNGKCAHCRYKHFCIPDECLTRNEEDGV